jgi:hypothetical protein
LVVNITGNTKIIGIKYYNDLKQIRVNKNYLKKKKRFEGKGKYDFSTGTKYEGELKDGMFHGKGTLFFENGAKYEALWVEGVATQVIFTLINLRFYL